MNNKIFVFGSNKAGRHGKGAALYALKNYGAIYGVGSGPQGASYAIPTKDKDLTVLPLQEISKGIDSFIEYAKTNTSQTFLITRVGCGLAGYDWDTQIRPLFPKVLPPNCVFIND